MIKKDISEDWKFEEYIPISVDVLLHQKIKHELIFCMDNANLHLRAVLQRGYKKFLCFDEA